MSKGNDSRVGNRREGEQERRPGERPLHGTRNSRSSVTMTAERARAIQSHADRTGLEEGFKSRAMSAAVDNETNGLVGDEE